jgi:CDP-2,3-bis-(O-geranylgeranyl)-sn-glycerol synthase
MKEILSLILKSVWYIFPAYMANNSPVFAKKIFGKRFSQPVDFDKKFMGNPLFGRNKTYRGIISGTVIGVLIVYVQSYFYSFDAIKNISLIDYTKVNLLLLGFLMGFGALFGDLVKSFIKRRLNISPGKSWIPFDQTDFLIGSLLFSSLLYIPEQTVIITILIVIPVVKLIIDQIGFYLKINEARL